MESFISLHLNKGLSNGIKVNTLIIFHVATECNLGCTPYMNVIICMPRYHTYSKYFFSQPGCKNKFIKLI